MHAPTCFDPETVAAWFDGCLTESERAAGERHLEACDDCRALLVALARDRAPTSASPGAAAARAPVTVGSHVGRYVITGWLGAGGMGVVYAAYDAALERRVAIKILSGGEHDGDDGSALLREAQAAARVSHPNVVAVHDAGNHDGQRFVAMELVEGATLADWLAGEARGVSAILALFSDAARGLAAVHAAGLVHADFKPSNVLVDAKGRALVSDFGLAHVGVDGRPRGHRGCAPRLGTPRYMSPEQRRGDPIDALSDQFSFCLALAEALYGALLPAGSRPPARAGVASRIRDALQRGLSLDPHDRFPSMDALADVLVPPRGSPWKPIGIAALVAACASACLASYEHWRPHASGFRGCSAEGALDGVWNDERRDAVRKALLESGAPYASDTASEVVRTLDRYAAAWGQMRTNACEGASSRRAAADDILDRRLACLDDQARQLGSLVDVLAAGGSVDLAQAVDGVQALPPVDACGDSAALRRRAPYPLSHDVRRQVEAIREDLRRGMSLSRTGDYRGARGLEEALLDPARATGYRVVEAEVAFELGETKLKLGELPLAEDLLREAVEAAEAGDDDVTKARALIALTATLAERDSLLVEARRTGGLASAVLEHLPEQVELRAELDDALAAIDHAEGRYADALARARRGLERRQSAYGPGDERVAASLASCGRRAINMGDLAQGLELSRAALAAFERTLGPRHPQLLRVLRTVALGEMALDDLEGAQRDIRRAESVAVDALGEDHPSVPTLRGIAAYVLLQQHHGRAALEMAIRAEAQAEKVGLPAVDLIDLLNTIASADMQLGRFDDALAVLERSSALCASSSHPAFEATITEELQGKALLGKGRVREAIALLQRSLAMRESSESAADPDLAEARFVLARALWQEGESRRQARELAERARAGYAQASRATELEEVEVWLARHRVSSER